MKIWLVIFLFLPALGWAEQVAGDLEEFEIRAEEDSYIDDGEPPPNWVDSSHTVAADSAQALVEWMDDFFGDPTYDAERAESFLRLEADYEYDEQDGSDVGFRLRGKVQLPKISQRVELLFNDEDTDSAAREDREDQDGIALQVKVREGNRSRFDVTMGISSGSLKPGVRYRNEGELQDARSYRYVQRLQYEDGENFFTIGQVDLFQGLDSNDVVRWSNRVKYGDHTEGAEWRSRLSLFQRWYEDTKRPLAVNWFTAISGETRPKNFVKSNNLGVLIRRQIYRDFLFAEIEPTVAYRRKFHYEDREVVWGIVFKLEIALFRDQLKKRSRRQDSGREDDTDES